MSDKFNDEENDLFDVEDDLFIGDSYEQADAAWKVEHDDYSAHMEEEEDYSAYSEEENARYAQIIRELTEFIESQPKDE